MVGENTPAKTPWLQLGVIALFLASGQVLVDGAGAAGPQVGRLEARADTPLVSAAPVPAAAPGGGNYDSWTIGDLKAECKNRGLKYGSMNIEALAHSLRCDDEACWSMKVMALKIPQLKAECKNQGLPSGGNKADLRKRLLAKDAEVGREIAAALATLAAEEDGAADAEEAADVEENVPQTTI